MNSNKKKLNLTVDEKVIQRAKHLVEIQGESLSSLVEDFLSKLVANTNQNENWLSNFHKQFFPPNYKEPSDKKIKDLRRKVADKYL